jgi:aminopeptidase
VADERVERYARLLVERSVAVEPGWQVLVFGTPLGRPLVEELCRAIARRGAHAVLRLSFSGAPVEYAWALEAPSEVLGELAPVDLHTHLTVDAKIIVLAPENTRAGADLSAEQRALIAQATYPVGKRHRSFEFPWVGCQYPTPALAQDAGMSLDAFEDFLYGACLLDWDAEAAKMKRIKERFDRAQDVRIVGEETDLTLSLAGREGRVDDGHFNMPGGEVFYSPVEDSANGVVTFSEYPAYYLGGQEAYGASLRFENGRVVDATARSGEDYLVSVLDTDDGARRLGELGIGCNPGIQRHMRNTLFDEKIYGTVHLALGAGFPFLGGTNESRIHWDIVKDVRNGGRLFCDGELVQEGGEWRL